jgi:propanol-preferring alcohol dehydrogenase
VAARGAGVTSVRDGDGVGVFWLNDACGTCTDCVSGHEPLCLRQTNSGYTIDGTYAEYCLVSAAYAVPLPQGPVESFTPIMCAGVTAFKAVRDLALPADSWIVVSGIGGVGHLAVQYARARGLRVIAIDVDDEKLARAKAWGADVTLNAAREFPVNRVLRDTGGVPAVIVTTGAIKAYDQALRMLRRGGVCVLVGVPKEPLAVNVFDAVIKGFTIRGSLIGTRQDVREALQLVAAGAVTPLIARRPLDEVNSAVTDLREGRVAGRVTLQLM